MSVTLATSAKTKHLLVKECGEDVSPFGVGFDSACCVSKTQPWEVEQLKSIMKLCNHPAQPRSADQLPAQPTMGQHGAEQFQQQQN